MDVEIFEKYKKAGKVLAEVRRDALKKVVKPGVNILEVADFIETSIHQKGAGTAFPVNISINDIAAHYTPTQNETREIKDGDLVKIDIGVQVDGYIADSAITYCSEKNELVETVEACVDAATKVLKPGLAVFEVGKAVEETAKNRGLGLIVNLTGHMLEQNVFHGSPSIPNISNKIQYQFKEGDAFAIEPFVVPANGYAKESGVCEIYRYLQDKPVRLMEARQILQHIKTNWNSFPFAKRWLYKVALPGKVALALRQLEEVGAIESYPVLKENSGKLVAQSEHTFVIHKGKVVVTSKLED